MQRKQNGMKVNIFNNSSKRIIYRKDIERVVEYVIREEKKTNKLLKNFNINSAEITFLFVDDKQMKKYNKQYFNRTGSTDVISFSMLEGEEILYNNTLGDAVISVETAERNSAAYNNSYKEELLLLVIHAVLHILGYDHETDNGEMREKESFYFNKLVKQKK